MVLGSCLHFSAVTHCVLPNPRVRKAGPAGVAVLAVDGVATVIKGKMQAMARTSAVRRNIYHLPR
jgi:hypothetical protein